MPGRDSCHPMGAAAPTPTLGSTAAGLRFQLVRAPADSMARFVVLHEGRFSRIFLAELRAEGGAELLRFAGKVQSDQYKAQSPGHGQGLTNADIDELWQRESHDLAAIDSPHVARLVPAPPGLRASRPVIHCERRDAYFHPVCAETGEALTVCRDDAFLADLGLVEYSQDSWRYLYGGGAERRSRTFYRTPGANGERPRDGVTVRIGADLFRDFGRLVNGAAGDAAVQRAQGVLPCLDCEHRATCFPADFPADARSGRIPAEDQLQAVSFYDFVALPLQLLDVDYDQLCELLGGGDFADVLGAGKPAQKQLLQRHAAAFAGPAQWLFQGDALRFPLEVLRQKLGAFQEVVAGLRAVHAATGRPHFGLAPQNVMARLLPAGRSAPSRWNCEVQLLDLGGAVRFRPPVRAGQPPDLLGPGPEAREDLRMRPYHAADLQDSDGQGSTLSVRFRPAEPAGERMRLVVEAQGGSNLKRFRAGDWVCLVPSAGLLGAESALWARLEQIQAKGFVASAEVGRDDPCVRWAGKSLEAACTFFRNFGPPVDLYGLGMLLFRTLLANDQQPMDEVEDVVGRCLRKLRDELSGGPVDGRAVLARVQQFVAGKEVRARFAAANVLQRRDDRAVYQRACTGDREPVDAGSWQALLDVAFRLTTQIAGYSYADSHAESSPFLLKQVHQDVEAVRARLYVDLFAAGARDAAVAAACAEVQEQLRGELLRGPDEGAPTGGGAALRAQGGFRLAVQKDGDPAPQQYDFTREQVTIGRREVENLVRLNDPMVSSAHAVIEKQAEGYAIVDRNSTNGTEVDGIRLPGEVAQPLHDGSVIRIRPFTLVFHHGSDRLEVTSVVSIVSADRLADQVFAEYAARLQADPVAQKDALRQVLLAAKGALGTAGLLAKVDEIAQRVRGAAPAAGGKEPVGAKFFASAHKALAQLASACVGAGDFTRPDEIERFAAKLGQFVEATSKWIEGALLLRRELGQQLELGATSAGATGLSSVRTAADLRQLLLAWAAGSASPEQSGAMLGKFFRDVQAMMEGLLAGAQTIRRAIRDRLDPERLVEKIGRGLKTNLAAGSHLWKLYVETFHEVVEGKQFELELDRLLQKSLQDRRDADKKQP